MHMRLDIRLLVAQTFHNQDENGAYKFYRKSSIQIKIQVLISHDVSLENILKHFEQPVFFQQEKVHPYALEHDLLLDYKV